MKRRITSWLALPTAVHAALVVAYSAVTIAVHEQVNEQVRALQQSLGHATFYVVACGLLAAAAVLLLLGVARTAGARRRGLVAWLLFAGGAAALSYHYLFTVVSEAVHFAQYAILTVLVYPLVRRIGASMLWATLVGLLDEANQYWVLHADWGVYLDWNDVTVNLVGALFGGLVLALLLGEPEPAATAGAARRSSFAYLLTAVLLVVGGALVVSGRIALHAGAGGVRPPGAWLLLDRGAVNAQPFWITAEWAQKRFHVLSSAAGAGTLALGALFCFAVDRRRRPETAA
ncbi:MAG: hypothetical protein AB7G12_01880 [Thermoanaerobaculia bacterium]